MNDKNVMSKRNFICENIVWTLAVTIWYRAVLFKCIGDMSYSASSQTLWLIMAVMNLSGMLIALHTKRNWASIITNIALPYGIYTIIAYFSVYHKVILGIIYTIVGSILIYVFLIAIRKNKSGSRIIDGPFEGVRNIICFGMIVIIGFSAAHTVFGSSLLQSSNKFNEELVENEQTISNNIDTILLLQENEWDKLNIKQKLNVLQTVANIERRYLGIPNELNVNTANLKEYLIGYYKDNTHEIIINVDSLLRDDAHKLLNTICHEAYHSYQYRMIDVYSNADKKFRNLRVFRDASVYTEEFSDYKGGNNSYCEYYNQKCERDARAYGSEAVDDYYENIDEYLKKRDSIKNPTKSTY